MTVNKPLAGEKAVPSKRRSVLLAACAATMAVTVAACGGAAPDKTTKDGFARAPQKDGALTVWVDSTRLDAAKQYQQLHPEAKLDIVSYDGDANGSNYLKPRCSCSTAPARAGRTSSSARRTTRRPGRSTRASRRRSTRA